MEFLALHNSYKMTLIGAVLEQDPSAILELCTQKHFFVGVQTFLHAFGKAIWRR